MDSFSLLPTADKAQEVARQSLPKQKALTARARAFK